MERNTRARLLTAFVALACASTMMSAQQITTTQDAALAKLQAKMAANPNSFAAVRAVGLKLFDLKRYADSRPVLEQARTMRPNDGLVSLYAGLAAEEEKDYVAAKAAYTKYLQVGKTSRTKTQVQQRLAIVSKEELKQSARLAAANEQQLRGVQVPTTTVAVLPFKCNCADQTLMPLERGMAELVVSDLSRTNRLRVLERDRMQAIVDEIKLSSTAAVDPATAARTGKLIAAGRILNGQINAPTPGLTSRVDLVSAVVNANNAEVEGNPGATGTINALFDMEKNFVLDAYAKLGVTLTAEERRYFETRRVPSLATFLAFSQGLMAEDAGNMAEAARLFESARASDPGFSMALSKAQSAAAAQAGAQGGSATTKVEQSLRNSAEGQTVEAAKSGSTTEVAAANVTLANVVADVNPTTTNTVQNSTAPSSGSPGGGNTSGGGGSSGPPQNQNTVSQATGGDQPAQRVGQVTIVIKKPGTP
jgi:TolB-like protein